MGSHVLGLYQDPAPRSKMVGRRVVGGGIQDSGSMKPRIRNAHLLITNALDSCVKLLAVLHRVDPQTAPLQVLHREDFHPQHVDDHRLCHRKTTITAKYS